MTCGIRKENLMPASLQSLKPNRTSLKTKKRPAEKKVETKTFFKRWEAFNEVAAPIFQPIQSEKGYEETLELLGILTDRMTTPDDARYIGLFRLLSERIVAWEAVHEAPYFAETPGHVTLKNLMEEHKVSQYKLEKEGIANQSLLSKILLGKRAISKELAKKLAKRFYVSPAVFL
jgi:HTH-type transcriptional regulator / antitoxin HigA